MLNIFNFSLKPLEYSVNFGIDLDPQTKIKLNEFENKTISFIITGIPAPIFITGKNHRLCFSFQSDGEPQTTISGSPLTFTRLLIHKNAFQEFSSGDLQLIGNSDLAEKLFEIFGQLDIDWEEHLSKLIGDIPAHSLANFFHEMTSWSKNTINSFSSNISEFLQEEMAIIAPIPAINDFLKEVDLLRDDVERLAARIYILQTKLQHSP